MAKNSAQNKSEEVGDYTNANEKTCFIIMPISDHDEYPEGHFKRVYQFIIGPACLSAGFMPIRADEVKSTNLIALDIVKRIIEADMAICDLSSQNPNVLYEVGIRQAFNLPVTFIKDSKTDRIFDIQGFRDITYDENLRIDTVEDAVSELTEVIQNTYANKNQVNSLVTLLGIKPAKVSETPISLDTELILKSIKGLEARMNDNERVPTFKEFMASSNAVAVPVSLGNLRPISKEEILALQPGDLIFHPKFGSGRVLSFHKPKDIVIEIDFESVGRKQLIVRFATLYTMKTE